MAYRRARVVLAIAAVVVALAAGCGDDGDDGDGEERSHLPLTGQASDDVPDRPALFVKVDNTANARPQVGLGEADIVVEELAEGGLTRLAVGYHSALPETVGPVRSLRTSDIGIVAPSKGALVASGAARVAREEVEAAGVRIVMPPTEGFSRDSARPAPYNLMLAPEQLLPAVDDLPIPPDYLAWGPPTTPSPTGEAVSTATVTFSPAHTTSWRHDGRVWVRDPDLAADGDAFAADTVLVLRVTTRDAGYRDPAGNAVPETVLTGGGEAVLLHGGWSVPARWSKGSDDEPLALTTPDGEELRVPAGRTWIELVPEGGSVDLGG